MIFTVFKALLVIQPVLFCNLDNDTKGIGQEHMEALLALYTGKYWAYGPQILWLLIEDFGSNLSLELYILLLRAVHELASVVGSNTKAQQPFRAALQ